VKDLKQLNQINNPQQNMKLISFLLFVLFVTIPGIFLEDKLQMNPKGYAIWKKEIEPYLLKD
jgi:hypothetical protein